ncbi:MAG TPA: SAM-dependent methyltransferase [Steroidobacteraceae bacterium]|nr:SAM-dependent methyltransferase [Steroidobacteraceae bacterium]
MSIPLDLPELSADEAAHSARLAQRVREEIQRAGGWIDFAQFMAMALYEPGLGYYSAGAHKLGPAGDFVTAPEVAPVFSRCVAAQCAQVLAGLGGGEVLELGAGSGAMAAEVLAELERQQCLPSRYRILDVSADLRDRQHAVLEQRVPHLVQRVEWLDRLPEAFDGVIVGNELLDAMPVARFVVRRREVNALGVAWHLGQLELAEVRAAPALRDRVRGIEADLGRPFPEGYLSEVNLGLDGWLASVSACLRRGLLLFIDYGLPRREFYSEERTGGTVLCHFRHRFHDDVLQRLGLQDITAWVDFTAVADAAQAASLEVAGYTTQAQFLIGCGIGDYVADVADLDVVQRVNLSRQIMLLTLPGEMGERFKAIALTRGYDAPLRGFALRDLRHTL